MPKIYTLVALFLILGVIFAELIPVFQTAQLKAYSETSDAGSQSEILMSLLNSPLEDTATDTTQLPNQDFIVELTNIPSSLGNVIDDTKAALSGSANPYAQYSFSPSSPLPSPAPTPAPPVPTQDQAFIGDVIPPAGTPLFAAYQQGGYAWYQADNKVVVRFPDDTFRSFEKSTGKEIGWLMDRLSYDPLDSPDALQNYITNYHGEVVAETETWALVKFPSGGFIKIAKPGLQSTAPTFLTQP